MFQNLSSNNEEQYLHEDKKIKIDIMDLFNKKNLFLYIISFMVSMVSFNGEFSPFGLAIFAACYSNRKPVGIIFILTLLGTLIKFGFGNSIAFTFSLILFLCFVLVIRPNFEENERNEKQKLGRYVFISSFIVQAFKMLFSGFLLYDLILSIVIGLITYIFYKIFVNSIIVISEFGDKKVFSPEEVIGACLLISISFVCLNNLNFFGFSITNILSVMLVLFLGWKHRNINWSNFGNYNRYDFRNNNC